MLFRNLILILIGLIWTSTGFAQNTVDHLKLESEIADQMRSRIESVISTQLDKETFSVSVSVSLNKIADEGTNNKPKKKKKPKLNLDEPDLFIGLLDIDQIIESYEEEIAILQQQRDIAVERSPDKPETRFQLSTMDIRVGLHEKYGREYFNEFDNWVSTYISDQYGELATVQTEYIAIALDKTPKPDPKKEDKNRGIASEDEEPQKDPDTFDNRSLYEKMRDFQGLLFGLLLFLVGVFLIITFKTMKSRESFLPKTFRLDIPPLQVSNPIVENKKEEEKEPVEDFSDIINSIERITHKLGILCFDLGDQLKLIKAAWLRQQDGDLKLALLFDSMVTCREKAAELFTPERATQWLDALKINDNSKQKMEDAFAEMTDYHPQEKLELLEAMYWDLMTLKTLGPEAYQKPFSILEEVPEKYLEAILNSQDRKSRNIALLYLDKVKKNKIIGEMSYDQRRDLIRDTLQMNKIARKDFSDIETAIKVTAKSVKVEKGSEQVELYPKVSRVLSDLNPIEEMKILREVFSELPNNGEKLKRTYPTWAFFDEWDINIAPKVVAKLRPQVVTQLVRMLPNMQAQLLSCCPDGLRVMVESDLNGDYNPSLEEQRTLLIEAKRSLLRFMDRENLSLKEIYDQPILGDSYGSVG